MVLGMGGLFHDLRTGRSCFVFFRKKILNVFGFVRGKSLVTKVTYGEED